MLFLIAAGFVLLEPRHADPLGFGTDVRDVLESAERVEALELVSGWYAQRPSADAVRMEEGMWRRGPVVVLPPALVAHARRAVLSPEHFDANPPPDLCGFEPTWALQFIRANREVSVLVDRGCWRAHVSGVHPVGGSPWAEGGGGGKLTGAGHAAFLALHDAIGQRRPAAN